VVTVEGKSATDDDGYRYWTGREWTREPPAPAPPGLMVLIEYVSTYAALSSPALNKEPFSSG
jgi:hypothetical protein